MAQPLFNEHPLEQYLQDAGETRHFIPGSSVDLELELDLMSYVDSEEDEQDIEWCPPFLINLLQILKATALMYRSTQPSPFVERFKYDVISSSLLSLNLPSAHGRTLRSSLPGQLHHSRNSSIDFQYTPSPPATPSYLIPSFSLILFTIFLNSGYIYLAVISFGITVYIFKTVDETSKCDMTPSLNSLSDLIVAVGQWESFVQEAVNVLESDEPSAGASFPSSSSGSSIRLALGSSLIATQTQCDNIRHLFPALTSPSELSQLSEMYAPPPHISPPFPSEAIPRPLSLPSRKRTPSPPSNKRSTWNGSNSYHAQASSPATQTFKFREKRRSDLSALVPSPPQASSKSLSTPTTSSPTLPLISAQSYPNDGPFSNTMSGTSSFGTAVLDLRRKRMTAGLETLKFTSYSDSSNPAPSPSPILDTPILSHGSPYTPIQSTHYPLSLPALHHALQAALASKRYACSHLLALRFADEDDEGYWEDVRSVMGLLASTFMDASTGLSQALQEEQQELRDQNPSSPLPVGGSEGEKSFEEVEHYEKRSHRTESVSFAPLPSHFSRFATHVETITAALDDARAHLKLCVASLREETSSSSSLYGGRSLNRKRASLSDGLEKEEMEGSQALKAYDSLRRELGFAFRECERGRERLLDIVCSVADEDNESSDDLPGLGHDVSEDSDDKPDSPFAFDFEQSGHHYHPSKVASHDGDGVEGNSSSLDDATSHLLLATTIQHLPSPGLEQVFEADSGIEGGVRRERSKLTREERIKLAKARRESGVPGLRIDVLASSREPGPKRGVEMWGPGDEVVQELKDVIWKVGERRRKFADTSTAVRMDDLRDASRP